MSARLILGAVALAVAVVPVAAHASGPVSTPGGICEGVVDTFCREQPCTDELDCGLVPPCLVWTVATGCLL